MVPLQVQGPQGPTPPALAPTEPLQTAADGVTLEIHPSKTPLKARTDTTLTFNLGGDYREFKAVLGMDDSLTNATSAAKVTIEADNQVLFAGTVKRTDKPRPVALDVKAAKQLRVTVEADSPYNGAHVILADSKVQK